jgi:hypothetical protein
MGKYRNYLYMTQKRQVNSCTTNVTSLLELTFWSHMYHVQQLFLNFRDIMETVPLHLWFYSQKQQEGTQGQISWLWRVGDHSCVWAKIPALMECAGALLWCTNQLWFCHCSSCLWWSCSLRLLQNLPVVMLVNHLAWRNKFFMLLHSKWPV